MRSVERHRQTDPGLHSVHCTSFNMGTGFGSNEDLLHGLVDAGVDGVLELFHAVSEEQS